MEAAARDCDPAPLTGFSDAQRLEAIERWRLLRPHLEEQVPLAQVAASCAIPERTLRRWRSAYQAEGLAGLVRRPRSDRGRVKMPEQLRLLIEGLALRPPRRSVAVIHRQVVSIATARGWPVPGTPPCTRWSETLIQGSSRSGWRARNATGRCLSWCIAGRRPSRTRYGRPTTPSWTCGSWTPRAGRPGRG
ncbi:helix-turn-helix domain-containing protein [Nonomuraea sp. NPDC049480]|uniref:helix-turn-helix domain-containing protein n=1 Tax=Nonomuraea sp. NPDC049480 TaxID=3364353 RepID=UPI0037B30996